MAVLFADLQGFTHLCERLDPEEVVEILDVIYDRLGLEVERYGGHIDKVLGDGLMVLFGAPQAHEDDGLRAILSGLAMQKAMAELQPWLHERLGQALDLRVGIDAGPVVYGRVGPGPRAQETVIGDAANVASRLQRLAPPRQVAISDRARLLGARQVQFRKLGTVQLDGRAQAVKAYVAVAPFSPAALSTGAALVGRDAELQRLTSLYSLAAGGKTALVLLTGEAGIGKTRLLSEFAGLLRAAEGAKQPAVLEVRNRWEVGAPYKPIESLASALGVRPRHKAAEPDAGSLGHRRRGDPAGDGDGAAAVLAETSKRMPVVLLIDDWQWADAEDGRRLWPLVRALAGMPILVAVAGRRVEMLGEQSIPGVTVNRLRLPPLSAKESWLLLQQHPAFAALPLDVAETMLERSGGNPAHVLEYVESLIDQGHLAPSGDGWRAKEDTTVFSLPESLRNHVLSLLDGLDREDRQLLNLCAVIGPRFTVPTLCRVVSDDVGTVRRRLYSLCEAGLLVSLAQAEDTYGFRTELGREVVYDTMLKRHRRELHLAAGTALESWAGVSEEELAFHFVHAGVAAKATTYGLAASKSLLARGEHRRALELLTEMQAIVSPEDVRARAVLLERLGQAHVASGNCGEGLESLLAALALVRDQGCRGRLMAELGWAYTVQGRVEMAAKHYRRAQEAMRAAGEERELCLASAALRYLYDRP